MTTRTNRHIFAVTTPLLPMALIGCGAHDAEPAGTTLVAQASELHTLAARASSTNTWPLADYRHIPGGAYLHKSCVHSVPNGATVHADQTVTLDGNVVSQHTACAYPSIHLRPGKQYVSGDGTFSPPGVSTGWVEFSNANVPSGSDYFNSMTTGSWLVPPVPTTNDGYSSLIYLFPSMESGDYSIIIQPVLQYGETLVASDGYNSIGNYTNWTYAAWAVVGDDAYYALPITVYQGDTLDGTMQLISEGSYNIYLVTGNDTTLTTNNETYLYVDLSNSEFMTSAQGGVLEAYNISECSDFPDGSSELTDFGVATVTVPDPNWNDYGDASATWTACPFQTTNTACGTPPGGIGWYDNLGGEPTTCGFSSGYSTSYGTCLGY